MDSFSIALWASAGLVVLVLAGVRVAFAAAFAGFVGLCAIFIGKRGWGDGVLIAVEIAGAIPHSKSTTYALSLIPVFILIGFFAHYAGLTRHVFDAAKKWVGWLPGGLGRGDGVRHGGVRRGVGRVGGDGGDFRAGCDP